MEELVQEPNGIRLKLRVYFADLDYAQQMQALAQSISEEASPKIVWVTPALPLLFFS
jgi:hypothetical protein